MAGLNGSSVPKNDVPNVTLYPNPAKESVNILAEEGLQFIEICNLWGQQVAMMHLQGEKSCTIATNSMASGMYVVKISTGRGITTQKLIIR